MTNKEKAKKAREDKAIRAAELKRSYRRNWKAMSWCNKQGFTIYVAAQAVNSDLVKIFKQKGERFKPLNNTLYDQNNPEDVISYIAAIDAEYERMYNFKKDKNG